MWAARSRAGLGCEHILSRNVASYAGRRPSSRRLAALLCEPCCNFRRPDNPSGQNRIECSCVDLNALRDLARGKLFGGGFAVKGVGATGIMPGLFMVRHAGRHVPCFRDSLAQDAPPAPVDIGPVCRSVSATGSYRDPGSRLISAARYRPSPIRRGCAGGNRQRFPAKSRRGCPASAAGNTRY
jgi:hypothetical protein